MVHKALQNNCCLEKICPLPTSEEIREYVNFSEEIHMQHHNTNVEDEIKWGWTGNGEYSTKSAYLIQFKGRTKKFNITPIWRAKAEPKCRVFA
jgi:hypothetical protein